jgi:SPP1 gp7 family putative phage head morphogenesis protein
LNKRQKIVQDQFLQNEEAVIKRLKSVYNQSLKDIEKKTQELQDEINRLSTLAGLAVDDAEKATLLSMHQSKVYQKQYQDALKKQVGSILDNLQVEEFKSVSEYLAKCYEDGFIGTFYDLQGQGIPLCFPLDQEAMVRAVQLDSKISKGLYTRLGEDVALLKKKITAQVSRGIATGMSYQQVAKQLAGYTNIGYNNAVRIARTEGHRVQVQSGMDACYKAAEMGCNVVKQWDSTMDKRTRESHAMLDGQIRELDEPFSNGLMFPGDPDGEAAEVINCRCALLQRAKWALGKGELETLQEKAAFFGLDKAEQFEDYKKKYLQAAEVLTNNAKTDIMQSKYGYNLIQGEHSIDDDIKVSNPNYSKGREYQINCQRCVPTYEMRRRGYDVEALPYGEKDDPAYKQWMNIFNGASWDKSISSNRGAKVMQNIVDKMAEYGDGARAEIYCAWKGASSAHVFAAENVGGNVRFIDPQTGNTNCEWYFKHLMPSRTMMCRIDNLEPSDLIKGCCKNKG